MAKRALLILFMLLLTGPIHAGVSWSVWLYQPTSGKLLRLDWRGIVLKTLTLPVLDKVDYPKSLTLSADGNLAAYVVTNPGTYKQFLRVAHLQQEQTRATFKLPEPTQGPYNRDDRLLLGTFNATGTQLAFSYELAAEGWTVAILDVASGNIAHTLNHNDPAVHPYPELQEFLPVVQYMDATGVYFTIENRVSRPFADHLNYRWRPDSGAVLAAVAYPTFVNTTLMNGETVAPLPDFRFPMNNTSVQLPDYQRNTLHVYESGRRYPFFNHETLDIRAIRFIQGGERLLALAQDTDTLMTWLVVTRDGRSVRRLAYAGADVTGTPDGFVYIAAAEDEQSALIHINTREFSPGETLWLGEGSWRVIWADMPISDAAGQWNHLADAITPVPDIPPANAQPTPLPSPPPFLAAGMTVQVQTLKDEFLNLRDAPSLNSNVLVFLENGRQLVLLEGPVQAEGFTWWKVRLGPREGWVVEALPEVQTLIPPRPIAEEEAP